VSDLQTSGLGSRLAGDRSNRNLAHRAVELKGKQDGTS